MCSEIFNTDAKTFKFRLMSSYYFIEYLIEAFILGMPFLKIIWLVIIDGWAIMYHASVIRGQTTVSKVFAYTCQVWSLSLIPSWYVFVFAKSNRGESRWNEIGSTLAPAQLSARTIRLHSRTRNLWAAMCSIFSLWKIITEKRLYAWKESSFFPHNNFNTRYCSSDTSILLKTFLYDDNFSHSWGDVASFFFPESWYKWYSAEHVPSYMDALNLTSTDWSLPVTCSCIPFFNLFSWWY